MTKGTQEKVRGEIHTAVPSFNPSDARQLHFLFEAVWESAADAMALSDPDGIVLAANPAYCDFYGYLLEELIGQSFAVIFPEEQQAEAVEQYHQYFADQVRPDGVEATVRPAGGGMERLVDVRYSFIEQQGQRVAMLSVIRDITERARLQQTERELLREKNNFLLTISHDLKTPLTTIKGHAQVLLRRIARTPALDPTTLAEGLHEIETTTTRMVGMIEGLLDAASMRRGETLPIHCSTVDLAALVRAVVEDQRDAADRHRIVVEVVSPVTGWWDHARLRRVVENLLSNALKYSPDGGTVLVSIYDEQESTRSQAVLRVTDTGIGIPENDREQIFEPFYRATNVGEGALGSGIGLTGVQQIVELHGGAVSVESVEGEGSTFMVRLPIRSSEPPE